MVFSMCSGSVRGIYVRKVLKDVIAGKLCKVSWFVWTLLVEIPLSADIVPLTFVRVLLMVMCVVELPIFTVLAVNCVAVMASSDNCS